MKKRILIASMICVCAVGVAIYILSASRRIPGGACAADFGGSFYRTNLARVFFNPHFGRFEDWRFAHSSDLYFLGPDKLPVNLGVAILEKHLNDFSKIPIQLVKSFTLRMCPPKPGNVPTYNPVSGHFPMIAVYSFIMPVRLSLGCANV